GEHKAVTLNTRKRCSIKSLPNHLMIHLKRFGFDFDTMQQTKINDRLEFPLELNMYPYTKEGRAAAAAAESESSSSTRGSLEGSLSQSGDEIEEGGKGEDYYLYRLAGVVVHMGTANSGHYYSYIRPRDGGGEWLEFNDTIVSAFDVKDMEAECFGGQETSQYSTYPRNPQHGGGGNGSNWRRERTRNAFLLVYDRQALPSAACSHSQPQQQLQERQDDPRVSELEQQLAATSMSSASSSSRCVSPPPPPPPPKLRPSPSGEQNTTVGGISAGGGQNSDGRADGAGAMATGVRPRRRRQRRKRFRAEVPEVFLEQIWRENVEFWRWKKNVLDPAYYDFLATLMHPAAGSETLNAAQLQLATRY
ncbi:unnamed protein product, partial [Sphacelaria rigidula]